MKKLDNSQKQTNKTGKNSPRRHPHSLPSRLCKFLALRSSYFRIAIGTCCREFLKHFMPPLETGVTPIIQYTLLMLLKQSFLSVAENPRKVCKPDCWVGLGDLEGFGCDVEVLGWDLLSHGDELRNGDVD